MSGLRDLAQKLFPGGDETSREENALTKTKLNVAGMSCGHCKAAVEEELGKLGGVERSNADFEKGTVEVAYDEARTTTGELRAAVEEAGYTVAD